MTVALIELYIRRRSRFLRKIMALNLYPQEGGGIEVSILWSFGDLIATYYVLLRLKLVLLRLKFPWTKLVHQFSSVCVRVSRLSHFKLE